MPSKRFSHWYMSLEICTLKSLVPLCKRKGSLKEENTFLSQKEPVGSSSVPQDHSIDGLLTANLHNEVGAQPSGPVRCHPEGGFAI